MKDNWLEEQLRIFDPALPTADAWLPPSSWYTERVFFDIERDTVFKNNWLIAARAEQLTRPGDYVAGYVAHEPYVITRDKTGTLRAFYNVCRHHAAAVMVGEGNTDEMMCPYHGWTYGLDGRLKRAPELGGVRDFDRECFGLTPMNVEQWGPFVFVHMGESPPPLAADVTELDSRLRGMDLGRLTFVKRVSYMTRCNWKVFVDNYLDGGYHVGHVHEGLAGQLDMSSYRTEIFDRYSIQSGGGATAKAGAPKRSTDASAGPTRVQPAAGNGTDFPERIGDRVLYAWLYPNLMINRYGSIMDTNWVLPRGHEETEVIFDYYFIDPPANAAGFMNESLAASDTVQQEDMDICESVQRGLESSSYDRGRYSVKREEGEHHFHRLLAADFASRKR